MGFDNCHPAVRFLFFSSVIAFTIWLRHPVFLAISFIGAFICSIKISGKKALIFDLVLLPVLGLFVVLFASWHHFGITVLFQREAGNPVTLEALIYSLLTGLCIGAVVIWMSCVHATISTDQIVYMFGRISPRLSLFLSVILRMVPRLKKEWRKISLARQAVGKGSRQGNPIQMLLHTTQIFSILTTWLIESFVYSSDSMKSRGYTLKGRTAYSMYRYAEEDRRLLLIVFAGILITCMGGLLDQAVFHCSPMIMSNPVTVGSIVFYGVFLLYCLFPVILQTFTEFRKSRWLT